MSTRVLKFLLPLAVMVLFAPAARSEWSLTTPTLKLEMTCSPLHITLPGDVTFQVTAINLTDMPRFYSGRINARLADGTLIQNWRIDFDERLGGREFYTRQFKISVPALPAVTGNHRFKCGAVDVTPPGMTQGIPAGYRAWSECIVEMSLP